MDSAIASSFTESEEEKHRESGDFSPEDVKETEGGLRSSSGIQGAVRGEESPGKNTTAKRKRIGAEQLEVLEEVFRTTHHPSLILRNRIAARLDLSLRSVQIWFQNRRAKAKKNGPQDPYEKETTLLHGTPHLTSSLSLGTRIDKEGDHSRLIEMLTSDEAPGKRAKLQQELLRELEKEKQKKEASAKKAGGSSPTAGGKVDKKEREKGKLKDKEHKDRGSSQTSRQLQSNQLSLSVTSTVINYNSTPAVPPSLASALPTPPLHFQRGTPSPAITNQTLLQHMNQIQQHLQNNSHELSLEQQRRLSSQLEYLQNQIRFDDPASPLGFSPTNENDFSVDSFYNSYHEPSSYNPHTRPFHGSVPDQHYAYNPSSHGQVHGNLSPYPHTGSASHYLQPNYPSSSDAHLHHQLSQLHTPYIKEETDNLQHQQQGISNGHTPMYSQPQHQQQQHHQSHQQQHHQSHQQQHQHQHLVLVSPAKTPQIQTPASSLPSATSISSTPGNLGSSVYLMVKNEPVESSSPRCSISSPSPPSSLSTSSSSSSSPPTQESPHSPSQTINPSALGYPPLNLSLQMNSSPFLKSN